MAYPGSSAQQRSQCSTRISADADVGRGSFKYPAIACLTLGLSRGMNGITQRELSFLLLLWGLSDPRIAGAAQNATEFQH